MFAEMLFCCSPKVEATRLPIQGDNWRLCEGMDIVWKEVLVLATKWIDLDDITELKEANKTLIFYHNTYINSLKKEIETVTEQQMSAPQQRWQSTRCICKVRPSAQPRCSSSQALTGFTES